MTTRNTHDRQTFPWRDSNQQSQQTGGHRQRHTLAIIIIIIIIIIIEVAANRSDITIKNKKEKYAR